MMFPIIRDRKIQVAITGCGRISEKHFHALEQHKENIELIAVCDNNAETLKVASERHQVPGYLSQKDLLSKETPDAVILCTPSGLHAEQAIQIAQAGMHVISEKPMATRWRDALAMVKACDEANVRLFVVKQNRQNTTLQLLKRAVETRRFGKIHLVQLNVFWTRPQTYYDQASWRGTWEMDGGAFMNQASHYMDLLDWLIGPVSEVQSMSSTHRNIEAEDTGVLNVRWRNGTLGSMAVTMCTYPENMEGSITILGEKGSVRIGGMAVNEIQHWQFEDSQDYDHDTQHASYKTSSVYGFGHPLYYKNVIDAFRGEAEAETDGRSGLKSLEIIIAAYLSARDNRTVSLPLEF